MCRGRDVCIELGTDPARWDKKCLLRPPQRFALKDHVDHFTATLKSFTQGDATLQELVDASHHDDFREWYMEHGQISGGKRFRALGSPASQVASTTLDPIRRISQKLENEVFKRDHYHCRYCGCRLIAKEIWLNLENRDSRIQHLNQRRGVRNQDVNGLIFATWPYEDHVVPHSLGGPTDQNNLVSSCFACNFGKDNYTCDQVGISDPLVPSSLIEDGWDGLLSLLSALR